MSPHSNVAFQIGECLAMFFALTGIDKSGYLIKFLLKYRFLTRLSYLNVNLGYWNIKLLEYLTPDEQF